MEPLPGAADHHVYRPRLVLDGVVVQLKRRHRIVLRDGCPQSRTTQLLGCQHFMRFAECAAFAEAGKVGSLVALRGGSALVRCWVADAHQAERHRERPQAPSRKIEAAPGHNRRRREAKPHSTFSGLNQ